MERLVERGIRAVALTMALAGGAVLVALTVLTVISVTGRNLNFLGLGPIPGDFELVEAGIAFAVFAFLPWCQLNRGHVTVDLFLAPLGRRPNAAVDAAANLLMTAAAAVIAWRMWLGLLDKRSFGETTFILQIPLWLGYAASMTGAAIFVLVSAWTVWRSVREATGGGIGAPRR